MNASPWRPPLACVAAVLTVALITTGCSGRGRADASPPTITSLHEWCRRVDEANDVITASNRADTSFAQARSNYRSLQASLDELHAALRLVPDGERESVDAELAIFDDIATAFIAATDQADAEQRIGAILTRPPSPAAALGAMWIQTECDR